jgi:hypothetical protein
VLNWLTRQPLRRGWFFEERSGTCRLMGRFAERLSETAPTWAQAVAPIAERVAKVLWTTIPKSGRNRGPATRLTQQHRREAKGRSSRPIQSPQKPPRLCRLCGVAIARGDTHCASCWAKCGDERMQSVAAERSASRADTGGASSACRCAATQHRSRACVETVRSTSVADRAGVSQKHSTAPRIIQRGSNRLRVRSVRALWRGYSRRSVFAPPTALAATRTTRICGARVDRARMRQSVSYVNPCNLIQCPPSPALITIT